jgi:hypothetical protein
VTVLFTPLSTIRVQLMNVAINHVAAPLFMSTFRWLRAVVVLAVLAVATLGSSARIGGEVNAALQMQGAHTISIVLLATPFVVALRTRRSTAPSGAT